jgi:hypothetical protein
VFSKEIKTSELIQVIFETIVYGKFKNFMWLDREADDVIFDDQQIRPDYIVYRSSGNYNTPMLVIEVKRTFRHPNYPESFYLTNHFGQLFRYLRNLAIMHRQRFMYGVLTDYKDWYFVRFDMLKELEAAREGKPSLKDCFEVSPKL